jgi:hypothetical protein
MFLYIRRKRVFSSSQELPNRCRYHGLKDLFSRRFLLAPTYLASNSPYKNLTGIILLNDSGIGLWVKSGHTVQIAL